MNSNTSVVKKLARPNRKSQYNILTYPTHEGYQTLLDKTGHNFYMLSREGCKKWETKYRPIPENHFDIPNLSSDIEIDFILSQERFTQLPHALQLSRIYRWPIIHLEHIEPQDRWDSNEFQVMKDMPADFNVFITEHNKKSWDCEKGVVIPHGIDTEKFSGWVGGGNYILYVVNDLKGRDYFCGYNVWNEIRESVQEKYPEIEFRLVGDNPSLGSPAKDENDLIDQYRYCECYLNTSQLSPIPMSLMEAMSVGCPVATTAKQQIPNVVKDTDGDLNGICSNNIDELVEGIFKILKPGSTGKNYYGTNLGARARKTIEQDFSLEIFLANWGHLFDKAFNMRFSSLDKDQFTLRQQ